MMNTISENKRQQNTDLFFSVLVAAVLLCYLICFGIINFRGFEIFCTADMYEDTLVARLMWEQKTLFPKNYLFGNQLYVLATPVLAALFYGITGSMNTGMVLATTLMSLLVLLSMDWMLKAFVRQRVLRLAALLMFTAVTFGPQAVTREDGQLFFVMCSFYACYLISYCFVLGDYVRCFSDERARTPSLMIALVLSFGMGIQSLRHTCVCVLPVLCFEVLRILFGRISGNALTDMLKRRSCLRAVCCFLANAAGLFTAKLINVTQNSIYEGVSIFNGASISGKFRDLHNALSTVTGFEYIRGESGWFFTLMFILFIGTVIASLVIWMTELRKKPDELRCLWLISLISILAVILSSFVTSVKLRPIYLFIYYILPSLSLIIVCGKLGPRMRNVLLTVICCFCALNIYFSYSNQIETSCRGRESNVYAELADYAVEHGFEYIYGAHSTTAPSIAVHSDGALIAGCWEDDCIFKLSRYTNIRDIYHLDDCTKGLYVFLEDELPLAKKETSAAGIPISFEKQFGPFYVYTASRQLMYPLSDNIDYAALFPDYN